jgi:predicted acylesterase/phospholipase RssA
VVPLSPGAAVAVSWPMEPGVGATSLSATSASTPEAAQWLRAGCSPRTAEALASAWQLAAHHAWAPARRILEAAELHQDVTHADLRILRQQRAVCTYKDPEIRLASALRQALEVLRLAGENLATTTDPETLGIAGAIHKRIWDLTGRRVAIVQAIGYYLRGARCCAGADSGYNAVNAAFLLDALAQEDERCALLAGLTDDSVEPRRERAAALRREVVARHGAAAEASLEAPTADDWWLVATVAEAELGLGEHAAARRLLTVARSLMDVPDWQLESTSRQLARLALMRSASDGDAVAVVADLVGLPATKVCFTGGKLGLALSGGGFRASFFHLGVLACLAELDVLRHVEVLSCVSGGSIVGAHYYLELRRRLQARDDSQMTRDEYVDVVRTVQRAFYDVTKRNLRRRALTNPVAVVRTLFEPGYNRTVRVGQLLDRWMYQPLVDEGSLSLGDLDIKPVDGPTSFDPRHDNWRRSAKVPVLVINATTLNTGHNWQFTTAWMGEPYAFIDDRTDANYRLNRVRLAVEDDPDDEETWSISLGQAVAASASVPGLLEPLPLEGVYPRRNVRLVDGGVNDNQGSSSLLAEDCTQIIVSDASGQMNADDYPRVWPWSTMKRASSILAATLRTTSFRELDELKASGRLRGLAFLHLKRDLRADLVTPRITSGEGTLGADAGRTSYGIPRAIQRHLAGLRTDLDVFSRAEVCTLMLSGYRMAAEGVPGEFEHMVDTSGTPVTWPFEVVAGAVDSPPGSAKAAALRRLLGVPLEEAKA